MFTQCNDYRQLFEDVPRHTLDGDRYYRVNEVVSYPSVTSVISFVNRAKFAEWREKVGVEAANKKTKRATTRGTQFHKVTEVFLQNGDYMALSEYKIPLISIMFNSAREVLRRRVGSIYQQETCMYSNQLCLAGTVDLICEFDGELAVVDFKTSEKEKPEEWLEDYFVQLSAYWAMFSERTGVVPKKLVVFLVGENGDIQIVERRNPIDYLKTLRHYVSKFVEYRDARSEQD